MTKFFQWRSQRSVWRDSEKKMKKKRSKFVTSEFEQTSVFQSRVKGAFGSYCLRHRLKLGNEINYMCDVSCLHICSCKSLSKGRCISKSMRVCGIKTCFSKEAMSKAALKE